MTDEENLTMSRPDPFLTLLKSISYIPLRLPRQDVSPLQLLSVDGKDFTILGQLADVMRPGPSATLPTIQNDISTANQIQGTRTAAMKLSIGLNLLASFIGAVTGSNLDFSAAYSQASTLKFEFDEVTVSDVSIILL